MTVVELCYTDVAEPKPVPAVPEAIDLLGSLAPGTFAFGYFGLMLTPILPLINYLPLFQQRLNPHQWFLRIWTCSMVCHQMHLFLVSLVAHISKQSNYNIFVVTKPPNLSRT